MTTVRPWDTEIVTDGSDPIDGTWFIDCDAHFSEPADLWSSRMAPSVRSRVPVLRTIDGESNWYLGDELFSSMGGNAVRKGGDRVRGCLGTIQPYEDLDESAWSVPQRLAVMDRLGTLAQIVYPNGIGFSSNYIFSLEDVRERAEILRVYNDFYIDVQRESNDRLLPQGMLPIWDMRFTVSEMDRLCREGMRGFTLSDRPELLGLPELSDPYYYPMWDTFNESGTVANFHLAAGATRAELEAVRGMEAERSSPDGESTEALGVAAPGWRSLPPQRRSLAATAQMFMSNARIVSNLCVSDIFDRYPKLKVMSAESGVGWVPFVMEALEYHFDDMLTDNHELRYSKRRPREYFADHIYVTFWFEQIGPTKLLSEIGVENVMIETDYPHPTCIYPRTREYFSSVVNRLDPYAKRRILVENAVDLYNLDISKWGERGSFERDL